MNTLFYSPLSSYLIQTRLKNGYINISNIRCIVVFQNNQKVHNSFFIHIYNIIQ